MNKRSLTLFISTLVLIGGTAVCLAHLRAHQKLGRPGVKTSPIPDDTRLAIDLPVRVLGCDSRLLPPEPVVTNTLPKDTSVSQRVYRAPDGWQMALSVVLMGGDRTSLHKPQFCLEGQGFRIDNAASTEDKVHIERPYPYDLPVVKLLSTKEVDAGGRKQTVRAVYVYWFVADGAVSASVSGAERMWWMAREIARTGVLQRWAYVSCLAQCLPGQEEATYQRIKQMIAASVPEFQLTPAAPQTAASAKP